MRYLRSQLLSSLHDVLIWHFHLPKNDCSSVGSFFLKGLHAQSLNQCNRAENIRHTIYTPWKKPYCVKRNWKDPKGCCHANFNSQNTTLDFNAWPRLFLHARLRLWQPQTLDYGLCDQNDDKRHDKRLCNPNNVQLRNWKEKQIRMLNYLLNHFSLQRGAICARHHLRCQNSESKPSAAPPAPHVKTRKLHFR